eukprot:5529049-Pyramimonas_sp.AAC.1
MTSTIRSGRRRGTLLSGGGWSSTAGAPSAALPPVAAMLLPGGERWAVTSLEAPRAEGPPSACSA